MNKDLGNEVLAKLRSDIFAVLRNHDVSEQCFAEVAMITQAALKAIEPVGDQP